MEFLGLIAGPVLALCVEVDREARELRYAGPFPESHHRMLACRMSRRGRSRFVFGPRGGLFRCSENAGRSSRTGWTCEPLLGENPMLAALYFALPLRTNVPTEWTDFMGARHKVLRPSSIASELVEWSVFSSPAQPTERPSCQSLVYDAASPVPLCLWFVS
jgi:hypothetical protein